MNNQHILSIFLPPRQSDRLSMGKTQQYPPSFQVDHPSNYSQLEHSQRAQEQAQEGRREVEEIHPRPASLERRVEHLENMYFNISKVNAQTWEAFRDIQNELIYQINAHDQVSIEKINKLKQLGGKLEEKNQEILEKQEKRVEEEEKKLEIKMQQFESMIPEKMEGLLQEERMRAEKLGKEQIEKLAREMDPDRTWTESKMQEMEDKMEKLEDRVQLKINEEVQRILTLVKEAEERNQGEIQNIKDQLREKESHNNELQENPKADKQLEGQVEGLENYVMGTPSAKFFTVNHNIITKASGGNDWRMVLLDVVVAEGVFSFRTHIHSTKGWINIGVTDRVTQKERDYPQAEYSIYYYRDGTIFYATGDGQFSYVHNGISISEGMELLCEVEREKSKVTFTVFEGGLNKSIMQVQSPILRHPERQFVPFFLMATIGDSVSWELQ